MARRKPKEHKEHADRVPYREIIGILLVALAVFAIAALYSRIPGVVGDFIRPGLRRLFGDTAVLFALSLLYLSVHIFRGSLWPPRVRKTVGYVLLLLCIVTAYHLYYYWGHGLRPDLHEEIRYGWQGEGAGVVGALLMVGVLKGFGVPGAFIMLGALFLIGIILYFHVSLIELVKRFAGFVSRGAVKAVRSGVDGLHDRKARLQDWHEQKKLKRLEVRQTQALADQAVADEITEPIPTPKPAERRRANSSKPKPTSVEDISPTEDVEIALPEVVGDGSDYMTPPPYILKKPPKSRRADSPLQSDLLEQTLASFGISAKVVNVQHGPVVTRYELQPSPGIKVSRITALADDLALALAAADVRIEAPVPGKPVVGIEVPNREVETVYFREVLEDPAFSEHPSKVALALGKDISGQTVIADLKKWLHLLVAGATGSGKSVCLNCIIASILFRAQPDEVKLMMIDPKRVELAVYDGIPHLITPVVTDPKKAAAALRWAVVEMERRYELFAELGVRNIDMYRELPAPNADGEEREHLPYIVVIIDELADLMMVAAAEVEDAICRLAQMARAAGIYLVIATQRPSVDVITGLIKANVPSRIAFAVSSQVDSRTILDMGGAERLIGRGDMLYHPLGAPKPVRAQGAWISDSEIEALVNFWKRQGEPVYNDEIGQEEVGQALDFSEEEDELLEDAIRLVIDSGQASISMLQRRFRIGYSRAARLIDIMEVRGVVGPYQGSKPREVLVDSSYLAER
ncbi:MAG: DNA translocase FtsK [Firmicutes bacterium]|nr:DNA translocase FtsK [Bacillota bacterium]